MTNKLIVQNTISIHTTIERVWDVLVNPEITKSYMFGCAALSDWKVNSPLFWEANYNEKNVVFVKGIIKVINPPSILVYTVIDATSSMLDIPENYLDVEYSLKAENGNVILTVTQSGFENAADGMKRYNDVYNNGEGWNPILQQIKVCAEKN